MRFTYLPGQFGERPSQVKETTDPQTAWWRSTTHPVLSILRVPRTRGQEPDSHSHRKGCTFGRAVWAKAPRIRTCPTTPAVRRLPAVSRASICKSFIDKEFGINARDRAGRFVYALYDMAEQLPLTLIRWLVTLTAGCQPLRPTHSATA